VITFLLQQQSELLEQIESIVSEISALDVAINDMRSQSNLLEKSRRKLVIDLYEVDKSLIRAICPTDESMRRFRSSLLRLTQASPEA